MSKKQLPTFRDLSESGEGHGGYEPQHLWLIPIYLRSREAYYGEAEKAIRDRIDEIWEASGRAFGSREAFERSETVANIWSRYTPVWWGLNDIVGWIDINLDPLEWEFQVSLFLPLKRISRRLKDKRYAFVEMERVPLPSRQTNTAAQDLVIRAAEHVASHRKVARCHVDLDRWKRVVRNTNLIGILEDFTESLRGGSA